jgi:LmbE family N-acetylglucosaminyl deacetylase
VIAPLVGEEEWLDALAEAPGWLPPSKRTVVIAPHPDDETLGAAGVIAWQRRSCLPVSVVAVTDGEAAYTDAPGLAEERRKEQESALQNLGVHSHNIVRLGLPDSKVAQHEQRLMNLLKPLLLPGTLVLVPWSRDWHPDHEACGRVAEHVARRVGAELAFYLFWTWHQAEPAVLHHQNVRRFEMDAELTASKEAALQSHRSQLERANGAPILPEDLLKPARRSFETFILHD